MKVLLLLLTVIATSAQEPVSQTREWFDGAQPRGLVPTNPPPVTNALPVFHEHAEIPWLYPATNTVAFDNAPNAYVRSNLTRWWIKNPGIYSRVYNWCGEWQTQFPDEGGGTYDLRLFEAWAVQSHASNVLVATIDNVILHQAQCASVIRTVAPGVTVTNFSASGDDSLAISNAVLAGVQVINYSRGFLNPATEPTNTLAAIQFAARSNIVFVCAAMNGIGNEDSAFDYPIRWKSSLSNLWAVGGATSDGSLYSYTGTVIDAYAPARLLITEDIGRDYYKSCSATYGSNLQFSYTGGTSFGTACESGKAALLVAAHPDDTLAKRLARLRAGVVNGLADVHRALELNLDRPKLIPCRDGLYVSIPPGFDLEIEKGDSIGEAEGFIVLGHPEALNYTPVTNGLPFKVYDFTNGPAFFRGYYNSP